MRKVGIGGRSRLLRLRKKVAEEAGYEESGDRRAEPPPTGIPADVQNLGTP